MLKLCEWCGKQFETNYPQTRYCSPDCTLEGCRRNGRKSAKKSYHKIREQIIIHYGGDPPKCACCGETIIEFLTIDHINNDGAKQYQEIGGIGTKFYQWLIKHNFPEGFRVLCYNCNCGRARNNGICPHKNV